MLSLAPVPEALDACFFLCQPFERIGIHALTWGGAQASDTRKDDLEGDLRALGEQASFPLRKHLCIGTGSLFLRQQGLHLQLQLDPLLPQPVSPALHALRAALLRGGVW